VPSQAVDDYAVEQTLEEVSIAYRLQHMELKCEGEPFDLRRYPYLIAPYDDDSDDIVMRKGGQMGMTILCVLRTIMRCKYMYPRGVLYLMPTKDDVSDFSKGRFDRIMRENPKLAAMVSGTDAAHIKRIGNALVYFRGVKSRSQLKSIPVDGIVYDEYDEMDMSMVALADKRLDGSSFQHRFKISTPTIPEFGIDWDYLQSDQKVWKIKCQHCNHWTCMELSFPDCLLRLKDNNVIRCCVKCKKKIDPINGEWVATQPGKSSSGYWVSQLNSDRKSPKIILDDYENPRTVISEFYNHRLAMSYADLDDLLDDKALNACCRDDFREPQSTSETVMGADVGKNDIHYVIARKVSPSNLMTLDYAKLVDGDSGTAFEQLHDKIIRYNVKRCVIDEMAETRSVREFKDNHPEVAGCWYNPSQRKEYDWNYHTQTVTVNRTESLDASHRAITRTEVTFPRPDEGWKGFCQQMKNLARQRITDDKTGQSKVVWVVRGVKNDHFRHAWNYLCISASDAPVSSGAPGGRRRAKFAKRPGSFMSA